MKPLVLVVEDEPAVANVTCRMLEALGYDCTSASSGKTAAALLESDDVSVDLAIIDVVLPDMLGTDLAKSVRERSPRVPLIFTSAYPSYRTDPPRVSGALFVAKPYLREELGSAIARLLPPT
jgi:two-component system cell cycle sensor histidine kinase/response regulator CckA